MNPASGSILLNEDALARLEAGLRAQREALSIGRRQPSPGISPADNDGLPDSPSLQRDPIDLPYFLKRDTKEASD
jgi:hypothetical protein